MLHERRGESAVALSEGGEPRWVAVFSTNLADVDDAVALIRRQILIAGAIALLAALGAGWLVARAHARRLRRLEEAAEKVADGDFSSSIPVDSNDEVGQLAMTFNEMQKRLERLDSARRSAAAGDIEYLSAGKTNTYPRVNFADTAHALSLGHTGSTADPRGHHQHDAPGEVVLDVRRDDERANGFIPGSAHIPLHSLLQRLGDIPAGRLWVHCGSGFRASIAASLLARAGRDDARAHLA